MSNRADVPLGRAATSLERFNADAVADIVSTLLGQAAMHNPDAIRKALLPVIGGKEYRRQLEALRHLCTNTRRQLDEQWKVAQEYQQLMDDQLAATEKRLEALEKRLDGLSIWLDGLAEKAREINRRVG